MAEYKKLETSSSVVNVTPGTGTIASWYEDEGNGIVKQKAKLSDGTVVDVSGGGSGSGYARKIVSSATTLSSGDWAMVDTDCTVTLPAVSADSYLAVSTIGDADSVLVKPATGNSILIDSTTSTMDGIRMDVKNSFLELFGTASGWKVAKVNSGSISGTITHTHTYNPPTVTTTESTVTSAYSASYTTAEVHRIKLTADTACTLTVDNMVTGATLVVQVNNASAGSLVYGSDTIIEATDTGTYLLSFVKYGDSAKWIGSKVEVH